MTSDTDIQKNASFITKQHDFDDAIENALREDIRSGDATTLATIPANTVYKGRFVAKSSGIIAGIFIASRTFALLDPTVRFTPMVADGSPVSPGQIIATIEGPGQAILSGERTALNFLQRMSGIATMTRQFVDAVAGTKTVVLDTRKTAPGLRSLDKLAVRLGGGQNHRAGLYDMILIKENHIAAAGGITEAVNRVRDWFAVKNIPALPIEVEVRNLEELAEVLPLDVDRIMLDNMSPKTMREAVQKVDGKVPLEASGNVSMNTIRAVAETGVDFISIGMLTHSVTALDISLLFE